MSKLPLVEGVLRYVRENNISFCMPGHKGGIGFLYTKEGREFLENISKCDITEVDGVDNLHHPEEIIKESQELLSKFYGSKKSYFLVNGSTSGNLSMIFSSFNEGDKVIVERNCHRSIFNGIIMRKLEPIYIENRINRDFNAPLSINEEHFLATLKNNKDAKGIILTYPNYYGVCCDLEYIIKEAKKFGMKVLIDSAHGAHFGVHKDLPKSAVKLGADMVVMSAHKTLPSFTQTAYLHVNNDEDIEKVDFYISAFLSTSPSYIMMCSMDYARFFLEEYGEREYGKLINLAENYKRKINGLQGFHIITREDLIKEKIDLDITRYVLNVKDNYSAAMLLDYLRENQIQAEMNDESNVILIFSPFNLEGDFKKLYEALKVCPLGTLVKKQNTIIDTRQPIIKFKPYEVLDMPKKSVQIKDALNKVAGRAIVPYPPGIPLVMPGELIDEKIISTTIQYMDMGATVLGVEEEKVLIIF